MPEEKTKDDHGHAKEGGTNPAFLVVSVLIGAGIGFYVGTLLFKMGMENVLEGGLDWELGKKKIISASVALAVLGLVLRFAFWEPLLKLMGKGGGH